MNARRVQPTDDELATLLIELNALDATVDASRIEKSVDAFNKAQRNAARDHNKQPTIDLKSTKFSWRAIEKSRVEDLIRRTNVIRSSHKSVQALLVTFNEERAALQLPAASKTQMRSLLGTIRSTLRNRLSGKQLLWPTSKAVSDQWRAAISQFVVDVGDDSPGDNGRRHIAVLKSFVDASDAQLEKFLEFAMAMAAKWQARVAADANLDAAGARLALLRYFEGELYQRQSALHVEMNALATTLGIADGVPYETYAHLLQMWFTSLGNSLRHRRINFVALPEFTLSGPDAQMTSSVYFQPEEIASLYCVAGAAAATLTRQRALVGQAAIEHSYQQVVLSGVYGNECIMQGASYAWKTTAKKTTHESRFDGTLAYLPHDLFFILIDVARRVFSEPVADLDTVSKLLTTCRSPLFFEKVVPQLMKYGYNCFGGILNTEAFKLVYLKTMRSLVLTFCKYCVSIRRKRVVQEVAVQTKELLARTITGNPEKKRVSLQQALKK